MKAHRQILKTLGINYWIAVKTQYNRTINSNDFYKMISRRTSGTFKKDPKELAYFFKHELEFHYKEFAQFN